MNTIKIDKKQVKMIAHRGLSLIERENTNPAFIAAANRSFFGIETDVRRTSDGKFIILHDDTTLRVSGYKVDIKVGENPADAVKDLVLPDCDGSTDRQDIRVPMMIEYIRICKKYEKIAVLEVIDLLPPEELQRMIAEIESVDYLHGVLFISGHLDNCINLRKLLPDAKIQVISAPLNDEMIEILAANRIGVDNRFGRISKGDIDRLHARGIEVNVWTCNNKEYAERLVAMGVDYITTDILE